MPDLNTQAPEIERVEEVEKEKFSCDDCGMGIDEIDLTTTSNGQDVCETCLRENYTNCNDCACILPNSNSFYDYGDSQICRQCAERDYTHCERCDCLLHCDDDPCCLESEEESGSISGNWNTIQDSDTIRPLEFYGEISAWPFGIGLELELGTSDPNSVIRHVRQKHGDLFIGKQDGSVNGVELVSQPATLEFWQALSLDLPANCMGYGYGGIHLHVCRRGWTDQQIRRIIRYFHSDHKSVSKIAQRNITDCAWCMPRSEMSYDEYDEYQEYGTKNLARDKANIKYSAVNLCHDATIEFRIFNSNKIVWKILKNMEYICALHAVATNGEISQRRINNYVKQSKETLPNLYRFMIEEKIMKGEN